ncbi:MAG TPA: acyl-CoA dehydrogenase, partial [Sphingobacterium sp.]|nr:acyl-CoA dehydrogenase [Sphingobacterium sp.]
LMGPAQAVVGELMSIPDFAEGEDVPFTAERKIISNLKKVSLMIAGAAVQKLMMTLAKEQEILMNIADIIGYTYVAESILLRAEKLYHTREEGAAALPMDMARVYLHSAIDKVTAAGKEALYSFAEGDELNMMLVGLRRFTKAQPFNVKEARQRIAKKLIEENRYCF